MDSLGEILSNVREVLGCVGMPNMQELGKMKQGTLEKKLHNLPPGMLNTRSIASIYMAWMAERIAKSTFWNDPKPAFQMCKYLQGINCSGIVAMKIWNEMLLEARMEHNMEDPWSERIHERGPLVEKMIIQLLVPDFGQRYPGGNPNEGMSAKEQTNFRDPNPPHFLPILPIFIFNHPLLISFSPPSHPTALLCFFHQPALLAFLSTGH
jgi:hypothetical protein